TYGWGERQRTILVTSVAPQDGKTLVAANLAVTFAREGARVLLVDCDLRRPRLHKLFQVTRAPGLVELLRPASTTIEAEPLEDRLPPEHAFSMAPSLIREDASAPAQAAPAAEPATRKNGRAALTAPAAPHRASALPRNIRETSIHGLWLLPCGAVDGKEAGTLKAGTFRALLTTLSSDFDVVILDTPPAHASADAVILAPVADDVLLVVRAGHTDRDAAERAHRQLVDAGGNVVGAVLNDPEGKVVSSHALYYAYGYPATSD
ncbi:MAG: CpsD/CapB family tyrosine-protein kinase, partial [Thermoanaerobaculia bacterium]